MLKVIENDSRGSVIRKFWFEIGGSKIVTWPLRLSSIGPNHNWPVLKKKSVGRKIQSENLVKLWKVSFKIQCNLMQKISTHMIGTYVRTYQAQSNVWPRVSFWFWASLDPWLSSFVSVTWSQIFSWEKHKRIFGERKQTTQTQRVNTKFSQKDHFILSLDLVQISQLQKRRQAPATSSTGPMMIRGPTWTPALPFSNLVIPMLLMH